MPRRTHPEAKSSRRQTRPAPETRDRSPDRTADQLAYSLVERGLASPQIMDGALMRRVEPLHEQRKG